MFYIFNRRRFNLRGEFDSSSYFSWNLFIHFRCYGWRKQKNFRSLKWNGNVHVRQISMLIRLSYAFEYLRAEYCVGRYVLFPLGRLFRFNSNEDPTKGDSLRVIIKTKFMRNGSYINFDRQPFVYLRAMRKNRDSNQRTEGVNQNEIEFILILLVLTHFLDYSSGSYCRWKKSFHIALR